jgi:hypothetical protein
MAVTSRHLHNHAPSGITMEEQWRYYFSRLGIVAPVSEGRSCISTRVTDRRVRFD